MLSVLLEIFGCDTVIRQLRVAGELVILVDNLLWRSAHLAFRAGAVKHAIDDIARRTVAVVLVPRTGFRRSHLFCYPALSL